MKKETQAYIEEEGLDKLIDFNAHSDFSEKAFDAVSGNLNIPFPPQSEDLVRIHKLIRSRKSFTALEFGLGYSTIIMADAMMKNEQEFNALNEKPELRNRFLFQIFAVDADQEWINHAQEKFPEHLKKHVHFHHSEISIGTFNERMCHFYDNLPDIVPDFIYLDGPSPKNVKGKINGMSFQCDERTVMSGDLLLMEPIFLPGTFILVDGRTNNVRFLAKNFQRNFDMNWDKEGDVTTFELNEERLGKYNILGSDFF